MNRIKTFDVVDMVLDEAVVQSNGSLIVEDVVLDMLKQECAIVDELIDEFDGESVEASIADNERDLVISLVCPEIVLEYGRKHLFFSLIQQAGQFSFSAFGKNAIRVDLRFFNVLLTTE